MQLSKLFQSKHNQKVYNTQFNIQELWKFGKISEPKKTYDRVD